MQDTPTSSNKTPVDNTLKNNRNVPPKKFVRIAVCLIGIALLSLGAYKIIERYLTTEGVANLPNSSNIITSTDDDSQPEEKKPTSQQIANYTVPPSQPRSITIKAKNIYGIIQKVGTTKDNSVGSPGNIYFAGWYTDSVKPGEKGLSIIDGHVAGKYSDGIFKHLADVKINDTVQIEFGDNSIKLFSVVEVKSLAEPQSAAYLFSKRADIDSQLNIITCSGKFDKATQLYDSRLILVTKLIEP